MLHIKRKDKVLIIAGKEKGKTGEVVEVYPHKSRVLIAKINLVKRHTRPTRTDGGGIKEKEASIHISNVMLICPKAQKPGRVSFKVLADGTKVRYCRKFDEIIV